MRTYSSERGFTLLELMIAVAVIAVLVGIAMPTYTNYSVRAKSANVSAWPRRRSSRSTIA